MVGCCGKVMLQGVVAGCCLAGCSDRSLRQVAMQVAVAGCCGRVLW